MLSSNIFKLGWRKEPPNQSIDIDSELQLFFTLLLSVLLCYSLASHLRRYTKCFGLGFYSMQREKPFSSENLEAIAKVLGETDTGMTGTEIAHTLAKCSIDDVDPNNTKWKRLYNAFIAEQNKKQYGNHVIGFIHKAMKPVLHAESPGYFEMKRAELNKILAFSGLTLDEDGGIRRIKKANTISEAEKRAGRLKKKLEERNVHSDVMMFCKAELLQENYFHAVLEATKSVASKIRNLAGITLDGAELATQAFSFGKSGKPILAINLLSNDIEKGEQKGFTNLLIGLFGTFRNVTAHAEKIYWPIEEMDALDILSIVSLVHRKLDNTRKLG